eukprot:CAMPEP_0204909124 /NCGR_PEP_ID=MMETSP1397-20131031/7902_1 /ASSEMBLY_ACC=CAM_ASM_000891 /TAXON_ID=49980 /ORGANISM="Climacostomum Climacostomum virens, Strain Stock W-24" /LENGTH=613 /DNA_ID=CAMNT_0052078859 /DNA_START=70 /DNA_END=1908 /DNA_ORIENTATION=-
MADDWEQACFLSPRAKSLVSQLQAKYTPVHPEPVEEAPAQVEHYASLVEQLDKYSSELKSSAELVNDFYEGVKELNVSRLAVLKKTADFNTSCADLIKQRESLLSIYSDLQSKAFYYTHYESLSMTVETLKTDSRELRRQFITILGECEDCKAFFQNNPQYARRDEFLGKYNELLEEWLDALHDQVVKAFKQCYASPDKYSNTVPDFDAYAEILKQLRLRRDSYVQFVLESIIDEYCALRLQCLAPRTTLTLNEESVLESLRQSCEMLHRLVKKEKALAEVYFGYNVLFEPIATELERVTSQFYDRIRPKIIRENSVEVLCDLSETIKSEFLGQEIPFILHVYQDIQERLGYRVQVYLSNEISGADQTGFTEDSHPVFVLTTQLLARLYNRVDEQMFKDLAQEAITSALYALKRQVSVPTVGSCLRLIWHVLALRSEVLAMLEGMELTIKSSDLDFTTTKHFFWKLVSGEVAFNSSSWLELVQAGAPKIKESSCSIQDLVEKALHEASSTLILTTFHATCDPIVVLLIKSRHTDLIELTEAMSVLQASINRIPSVLSEFTSGLAKFDLKPDDLMQIKLSTRNQILKAFQQLLSYIRQRHPGQELPTLIQVEQM